MAFPDEIITESELGSSVRTKVNRGLSTQGLKVAASGLAGSTSIPDGAWTTIVPTVFASNNAGATYSTGVITMPAAADGLWLINIGMKWKNDQGGLAKHRRRLRLSTSAGAGVQEIPELLFDPAMGDLTEDSVHNGFIILALPFFGSIRAFKIEAWQNSGIAVNILTSAFTMIRLGDNQ